jgi:hypothetical protein
MKISYDTCDAFEGWSRAPKAIEDLIERFGATKILEIGAGASPCLGIETVRRLGLDYTVNDIDQGELAKAPPGYRTLCCDFSSVSPISQCEAYDFVFSRMVNEHVSNGDLYYRNICNILHPGGISVHFFSTLYALPFLLNKILPDSISSPILMRMSPRGEKRKFQAHYDWARGPRFAAAKRFGHVGFKVLEYHGYFGHHYYKRRLPWLHSLEMRKARYLAKHPVATLTSYAKLLLHKPISSSVRVDL